MASMTAFQFKIGKDVISLLTKAKCYGTGATTDKVFTCSEIQIPTGYGYVAAKDWRRDGVPDQKERRVLAIHGFLDNAGSYDRLIPHLRGNLRVVAMDLPGHGLSSHLPEGMFYLKTDYLYYMKVVVDYLKWDTFSIMGHSMGGGLVLLFASLFPRNVDSAISFDILKNISVGLESHYEITTRVIEERLRMRDKLKQPEAVLEPDVALSKLMRAHVGSLNEDSARILLKRGVKASPCGGGLTFSRDPRLRIESIQPMDNGVLREYLSNLRCRLLVIKARNGMTFESAETTANYKDLYSRICKEFRYVEVDGTHHVHLNQPETGASLINDFWNN